MLGALDGGLVGRKDTERAKGVCGLGAEMIDGFVHNPEALRGRVELKEVAVDPSKVLHSCVHGEHVHAVEQRPGLFDHGAVDRLYPDVDDALAVVWQLINGVRESTSDVAGFSEDGGGCIAEYPVVLDGQEVTELQIRRAKARDSRDAQRGGGGSADNEIRLFANLCEVAPAVIEELDMADYMRLQKVYEGFLSG